jgi:hypothetical protein
VDCQPSPPLQTKGRQRFSRPKGFKLEEYLRDSFTVFKGQQDYEDLRREGYTVTGGH